MSLDLDETVQTLTDDSKSVYLRAIRLFEFQICLFFPESLSSEKINYWHANARLLAALKFLEHFEEKAKNKKEVVSLRKLAANSNYAEIFDNIVLKTAGSRGIRSIERSKEFDKQIGMRRVEAGLVTRLVDFSFRFACLKPKTRGKGGIRMACSIVSTAPSYKSRRKLSTLKTRWRKYGRTACFLYLLVVQRYELIPHPITSEKFTTRLLEQAKNIEHIRELFLAYQYLCDVLKPLGYNFPTIRRIAGERPDLPYDRFPDDVQDAIKNYKSAK